MDAGWEPGKPPKDKNSASGPHRVMAQALMKRAIGDIPIVTFIQKESAGMNKLYSQSMCSVSQWRAYQNAEAMVSAEVDEVRAEADEIEPGWSQVRILKWSWIFLLRRRFYSNASNIVRNMINMYIYFVCSDPFRLFGGKLCNITTC